MFEFDDFSDEEILLPSGTIVIDLLDGRAIISRCRYLSDTLYVWEQCSNWRELESNVLDYLRGSDISYIMGGFCVCPDNISALASWLDKPESILPSHNPVHNLAVIGSK